MLSCTHTFDLEHFHQKWRAISSPQRENEEPETYSTREAMAEPEPGHRKRPIHRIVGMENSAPSLMPEGQREVMVLVLV
jgi:hypothetical protein